MSAAVNVVKKGFEVVREVTGGTYDAIGKVAQKVGNTVESILENPKQLAAVAISMAFPAAAPSIGNWILGAELAAAYPAAAAAVGNMCLNTAMNGGDVGQAVKTTALQYVGNVGSQKLTEIVKNADLVPDAFAKNVGTTTTYAAIQAAQGKDPTVALLTGGANACAQVIAQEIPGFTELPKTTQEQITRATAAAIQGNSTGVLNAAIDFGVKFAKDEYNAYKEANNNGFGYDAAAWKDAKAIGVTDLKDYQYAKEIGADNPYDLQVGKAIGAKDNFDLQLAKDIGLSTADDFNYAKQIGVSNKEDFDLAKDIGAQNALDIDFAKQLGIDTSQDFGYARNLGVNNAEDFNFAKQVGAQDLTDLNVAKQYGITDKDTLDQYSDFLGRGTEIASTNTIQGANGDELTIDNEGNVVKYTYGTGENQVDLTEEVAKAARSGGYTLRGDDGSTITINPNGTVSAMEAPEDQYLPSGQKKPSVSYASLIKQAAQNRAITQKSEQGGINEATIAASERMKASPLNKTGYQVTQEDIAGLIPLLLGDGSEQQVTEEGEDGLAKVEVGGPEDSDINYLANLGERPSYLGSLEKGQPTEGAQVEPGKDAGAASRGAVFGPPVGVGGGGAGFDRYYSSGPMGPIGGGAGAGQYGLPSGGVDIIKTLQSAGLQDQSNAETQRLLNAQGPVAIGRIPPPVKPTGLPVPVAPVAAPAAPALAAQANAPVDPLKQLQEYAGLAGTAGSETVNSLLKYLLSTGSKPRGTEAYKDMFGNIRTR